MKLIELAELLAKALVDDPDQVEVREIEGERSLLMEIRVSKQDLGKIIGRQGRNAAAMRTILGAAGAKLKKRVTVDIIE